MTAYQITSMMEGVVQGGTAAVMREVGKPIAGKTGTTSDAKDLWFDGFSPDLVVGLYLGYDKPRSLGRSAQGGHTAGPIARDFMKFALADKPAIPFRMPAGIKLIRVDPKTGMRAGPGDSGRTILEAFKPGTAPDAGDIMRPGTGGLYSHRLEPETRLRRGPSRLRFAAPAATSLATSHEAALRRRSEKYMRAEVERLVEEIKQSVGLLRRHL